jgi:hypothetical protein
VSSGEHHGKSSDPDIEPAKHPGGIVRCLFFGSSGQDPIEFIRCRCFRGVSQPSRLSLYTLASVIPCHIDQRLIALRHRKALDYLRSCRNPQVCEVYVDFGSHFMSGNHKPIAFS